jgi:hypothetical protein
LLLVAAACSRSYVSPLPTSLLDPSQPRSVDTTVRIRSAGVTPAILHLDGPVTVTFVNDDAAAHRLEPAPELGYGSCSEMEQLGALAPSQSGRVTIERRGVICTYRDAAGPGNPAFQGYLVVH